MKKVTLSYEQSEVTGDEGKRWMEAAFDVLFDSVFGGIKDFQHIHKFAGNEGENDDRNIALPISA